MLELLFFANIATITAGLVVATTNIKRESLIFFSLAVIAIQSTIIGLRDPLMMTDTREYVALFYGYSGFDDQIEPLFMELLYAIRLFTESADVFLIIIALILNVLYFSFLYLIVGRCALLSFGLFGSTFIYWLVHVQIIRSGLASILLLICISLFMKKKVGRGVLFFAFSIGTHFSIGVISIGVFLGRLFSRPNIKHAAATLAVVVIAFLVYEFAVPKIPFLEPWKRRLDAYAYYDETLFIQSRFSYVYAYFVVILLGFIYSWKRQDENTKLLFNIYMGVVTISFMFWFNILYRDRIFSFAQLMEPLLLMQLFMNNFGRKSGALLTFAFGILTSSFVIFVWGPRTVLLF